MHFMHIYTLHHNSFCLNMTFLLTTFAYRVIFVMFRALSISPAKPVLSALPVLLLMESASLAGNFGNVNKRLLLTEFDGDVAGEVT